MAKLENKLETPSLEELWNWKKYYGRNNFKKSHLKWLGHLYRMDDNRI